MNYPVNAYDLDGLLAACHEVMPAGLAYDVVGLDHEDLLASDKDPFDYVKDQILNHEEYVFLLCHEPSDGKAFKFADGTEIDPSPYEGQDGTVISSDIALFGVEIHMESDRIELTPSVYDMTFAEVFSLDIEDEGDEQEGKFRALMLAKIDGLISSFAKGATSEG
jgi:hypothetical protein